MRKPSIRLKRFLERILSIYLISQLNLLRRTIMSSNYSGTKENPQLEGTAYDTVPLESFLV